MQDDASMNPTIRTFGGWRLIGAVLLILGCGVAGWMIGHGAAVAAPVFEEIGHIVGGLRDTPAHHVAVTSIN